MAKVEDSKVVVERTILDDIADLEREEGDNKPDLSFMMGERELARYYGALAPCGFVKEVFVCRDCRPGIIF